ncbi:DUF3558 domain-containing protein [Nocardia sp. NPDC058640]|uniref:DUF3558 domain-containing protein n=1 Tax=Nocardia sp. NPDC058640 TaxID=3346571 RepID=UPI00364F2CD0
MLATPDITGKTASSLRDFSTAAEVLNICHEFANATGDPPHSTIEQRGQRIRSTCPVNSTRIRPTKGSRGPTSCPAHSGLIAFARHQLGGPSVAAHGRADRRGTMAGVLSKRWHGLVVVVGAALVISACGPDSPPEQPTNTSPTFAAGVPTGFDPCTQIPVEVFESENLRPDRNPVSNLDAPNGVKWRGCGWGYKNGDGYGTKIRTTNLTLEMIRARNFTDAEEFATGGRQAIVSRQQDAAVPGPGHVCTANVDIRDGSLDIFISNPEYVPATGHIPACTIARTLAEKIAPSIPAGA